MLKHLKITRIQHLSLNQHSWGHAWIELKENPRPSHLTQKLSREHHSMSNDTKQITEKKTSWCLLCICRAKKHSGFPLQISWESWMILIYNEYWFSTCAIMFVASNSRFARRKPFECFAAFPNFGNQNFIFIGIKNIRCYSVLNMRFFSDVMVVLSVWQNNAQPFVCFWFLVPPCQTKGKTHKTQTCFELNIVFVWHCATHLQNNSNTLVKVKQMRRPMQIAPWMQELFHEVFHMIPNTKKKLFCSIKFLLNGKTHSWNVNLIYWPWNFKYVPNFTLNTLQSSFNKVTLNVNELCWSLSEGKHTKQWCLLRSVSNAHYVQTQPANVSSKWFFWIDKHCFTIYCTMSSQSSRCLIGLFSITIFPNWFFQGLQRQRPFFNIANWTGHQPYLKTWRAETNMLSLHTKHILNNVRFRHNIFRAKKNTQNLAAGFLLMVRSLRNESFLNAPASTCHRWTA